MSYFFNNSGSLKLSTSAITNPDRWTMNCFARPNQINANDVLMFFGDATKTDLFEMFIGNTGLLYGDAFDAGIQFGQASSAGSYTANAFHCCTFVRASDSSMTVYLNGVAGAEVTTTITPDALVDIFFGGDGDHSDLTGYMGEWAIWDDLALTPTEISFLAAFGNPQDVQLANLPFYCSGKTSLVPEVGAYTLAVNGTVTQDALHPVISAPASGDTESPDVSLPTVGSITNTSVVIGGTTALDPDGVMHCIIVADGDEAGPTDQEIIDGNYASQEAVAVDLPITAEGVFAFAAITGLSGARAKTAVMLHVDSDGNYDAGSRQFIDFTLQSATITINTDLISGTIDGVLFDGPLESSSTVLIDIDGETTDGSGDLVVDLNAVTVTNSQALEGIGKDRVSNDPIPLQGTVSIA